eukprot:1866455-Rhodomonas_salina.1
MKYYYHELRKILRQFNSNLTAVELFGRASSSRTFSNIRTCRSCRVGFLVPGIIKIPGYPGCDGDHEAFESCPALAEAGLANSSTCSLTASSGSGRTTTASTRVSGAR